MILKFFSSLLIMILPLSVGGQNILIEAPAGKLPTAIGKEKSILPNGRFITPKGKQIKTAPHPYGLVLSHDGNTAVTANSGIKPFSITIIKNIHSNKPKVIQVPKGHNNDEGILEACFMGLAISPDDKVVYVAGGESNKIFKYSLIDGRPLGNINCAIKTEKRNFTDAYLGDMVMTRNGKKMYVVDQIGFRIAEIDLVNEKVIRNIPTGRYPFGIALSPDESNLIVANVGVFEYKKFTDLNPKDLKNTAHTFPASQYGSDVMVYGDASHGIPPLGDPNSPEGFSVWIFDLQLGPVIEDRDIVKIKTGFLVGQKIEDFPTVGGSSPNSIVVTEQYAFVSNGNNDCVSVIDITSKKLVKNIALNPEPRLESLRGIIPFGLAMSPDQKRIYVAESGINAVGIIDVPKLEAIGHIPCAWFPSKLKISPDGKSVIVANAKGMGSGPNGGKNFMPGREGSYIGGLMKGYVSVIDIPTDQALNDETKKVIENNFDIKSSEAQPSSAIVPATNFIKSDSIKYLIFIAKENRTYDEVFGQLANGNGDATLSRFGNDRTVKNKSKSKVVTHANVMPNHIALAKQYAISDNFYCDSDVSADGHRWLVNTYPNEWCETATPASYGGKLSQKENSDAPGNLGIYGSAGSIYPEDYNEGGSMWEHLQRNNIDFYNFGFGVEMAGAYSDSTMKYIGELYTINYPLPAPLFEKTSRVFPTYNMAIPDQFRTDLFIKEFNEKWADGGLPSVVTLMLPNDHGTSERPHAGYPFQASYMADNDLAVGRAVEFLSHTKYWKNMAIFITEDDPQGGVDHVDAHRSILMVISPYAKKNYVGKYHYSFGSIFKTFWNILGIPYLNQYDAGATALYNLFTDTPDYSPYNAVAADKRIFDPQHALTPIDEKFDWKAFSESEELDKTENMQKRREEDDKEGEKVKVKKKKKIKGGKN